MGRCLYSGEESEEKIHENHPLFWAIEKFINDSFDDPETCWKGILGVLSRNPSQKVISILAAGPLEDLIESHGPKYIDRIEEEARRNQSLSIFLVGFGKVVRQKSGIG